MRPLTAFLTTLLLLSGCGTREADDSSVDGIMKTKYIADPYYLNLDIEKDVFNFKDYVDSHAAKPLPGAPAPSYTNLDIAYDIFMVSQEVGIDPRVLLALVRKESSYRLDAKSPTGAVGLTQFTGLGVKEIKEQLGTLGTDYALKATIAYWQELVPRVYGQLSPGKVYEIPTDATTTASIKQQVVDEPLLGIIYGAMLLKTNLAAVKEKNIDAKPALTMEDLYRKALENYNGDPPVKEEYAKTILLWAKTYESN